jgi:uncharacterized protein YqgV (UPF0045/DUF77 family)
MEDAMERVTRALDDRQIAYEVGPIGTTLEAHSMEAIMRAVQAAHEAVAEAAPRLVTEVAIDHRLDKAETARSLAEVERGQAAPARAHAAEDAPSRAA